MNMEHDTESDSKSVLRPIDEKDCYGATFPGLPGFGAVCAIDPKWKKETAKTLADWIRRGATVSLITREEAGVGMRMYLEACANADKPKLEKENDLFADSSRSA